MSDVETRLTECEHRLNHGGKKLTKLGIATHANNVLLQEIKEQVLKTNGRVTRHDRIISAIKWTAIGLVASGLVSHFGLWETLGRMVK